MDKLKQIDSILKKAVADVPHSGILQSSDWDAIEQKLNSRKRRIIVLWSFVALMFFSSVITYIVYDNPSKIALQIDNSIDTLENKPIDAKVENPMSLDLTIETTNDIIPKIHPTDKIVLNNSVIPKNDLKLSNSHHDEFIIKIKSKAIKAISIEQQDFNFEKIIIYPISNVEKSNNIKSTFKGWEYGLSFTPSVSNKIIQENNSLSGLINRNYNQYIGNQEKSSFANNFGINLSYHISPKIFISSGLYLTQRSEYLNYKYTITEFPIVTNGEITDYAPLNPLAYVDVNHVGSNLYHFIEIPLNFGYKQSISSNFEIRSQFGVSLLSLTKLDGKKGNFLNLQLEDLTDLKFNNHNIATTIKSGLYFNKPRFNIGVEPSYSINLNSLTDSKTTALNTRPYSYGINLISNIKIFKND